MTAVSTSFDVGCCFRMKGKRYTVESSRGRTRSLVDHDREELVVHKVNDLTKAYLTKDLEFIDLLSDGVERGAEKDEERLLISYPEKDQIAVRVKLKFLKRICPRGRLTVRRDKLSDAIKSAWEDQDLWSGPGYAPRPDTAPGVSTFYLWRRRWINSNYRPSSLVNHFELRGRRPASTDPHLENLLDRAVDEIYAQKTRPTVTETLDLVTAKVDKLNHGLPPAEHIPRPTRRSLERAIHKMDRFELLSRRNGRAIAAGKTRVFGKRKDPVRLMERVEIDHTPLDLFCIADKEGLILGRPFATIVIEVKTRMILAAWISFRPANADVVLRALKQAILPKAELLKKYRIKGDWPACGVPHYVVTDNGKELKGTTAEQVAEDLGFDFIYCPKKQPRFKGTIERFIKSLNYRFIHLLPGTTFAKYYLRDEYESLKNAVIPLEDLRRFVYRWIVEVYIKKVHRGFVNATCPLVEWERLAAQDPPVLPRRADVLEVLLTPTNVRTLSSKGIEINKLFYKSPELSDIRLRLGNVSMTVKPQPDDMGHIHFLHPETKQFMTADCTFPQYAKGLSQEQHDILCQRAVEQYKALPHERALLQAKLEMREEVMQLVAERMGVGEGARSKSRCATPKPKKSKSGVVTQALTDTAAMVRAEDDEANAPSALPPQFQISFDEVEVFSSGQSDLF